jgi:hypothetical protein
LSPIGIYPGKTSGETVVRRTASMINGVDSVRRR